MVNKWTQMMQPIPQPRSEAWGLGLQAELGEKNKKRVYPPLSVPEISSPSPLTREEGIFHGHTLYAVASSSRP